MLDAVVDAFERGEIEPSVDEIAESAALAQQDWVRARDEDDWTRFAPHLENLVDLKRREADAIGFEPELLFETPSPLPAARTGAEPANDAS